MSTIHLDGFPEAVAEDIVRYLNAHQLHASTNDDDAAVATIQYQATQEPPQITIRANEAATTADASLVVPFTLPALFHAIQPYLSGNTILTSGAWRLDLDQRQLVYQPAEATIELTEKECHLLQLLFEHAPDLVSRKSLLEQVFRYHEEADTHTLETHIYRLRQKLESSAAPGDQGIVTQENGYRWQS